MTIKESVCGPKRKHGLCLTAAFFRLLWCTLSKLADRKQDEWQDFRKEAAKLSH